MFPAAGKSSETQSTWDCIQQCLISHQAVLCTGTYIHMYAYTHVCTHSPENTLKCMHTCRDTQPHTHTGARPRLPSPVKATRAFHKLSTLSCVSDFTWIVFLVTLPYGFSPKAHHLQDAVAALTTVQNESGGRFLSCLCLPPTPGSYSRTSWAVFLLCGSQGLPRALSVQRMKHMWISDTYLRDPQALFCPEFLYMVLASI